MIKLHWRRTLVLKIFGQLYLQVVRSLQLTDGFIGDQIQPAYKLSIKKLSIIH